MRYEGPGAVSVEAPLDRLPLFVRCGAIVPLGPTVQHLSSYAPDEITLLTYPEGSTRSSLYDDDGETNAYRGGAVCVDDFFGRATFRRIGASHRVLLKATRM